MRKRKASDERGPGRPDDVLGSAEALIVRSSAAIRATRELLGQAKKRREERIGNRSPPASAADQGDELADQFARMPRPEDPERRRD